MGEGHEHGEVGPVLAHPPQRRPHKLSGVTPAAVGRVGGDVRDTAHRNRPAIHEYFQRQHGGHRPDLSVRLDHGHPVKVEPRVRAGPRCVTFLPLPGAAAERGRRHPGQRAQILFPEPA